MKTHWILGALAGLALAGSAQAATVYVGSYQVDGGEYWYNNSPVYSAAEAAALIFGGVASDYDISTVSNQIADINNMGWYTTWGITGGQQYNEDFKYDLGNDGYGNPGGSGSAISAYTWDNAQGPQYTNYVFRVDGAGGGIPEPATWAMMLVGVGMAGGTLRRSRRLRAVAA